MVDVMFLAHILLLFPVFLFLLRVLGPLIPIAAAFQLALIVVTEKDVVIKIFRLRVMTSQVDGQMRVFASASEHTSV